MYWRVRYSLRRIRLHVARAMARSPVGILLRGLLPLYLILGLAAGAFVWFKEYPMNAAGLWDNGSEAAHHWYDRGSTMVRRQLSIGLDAETGKELMRGVLPAYSGMGIGPEPIDSWRTPMRAWVFVVTGFDFSQPRSFLEANVPGFRTLIAHELDVVRTPQAAESSEPAGADAPQQVASASGPQEPRESLEPDRVEAEREEAPVPASVDGAAAVARAPDPATPEREVQVVRSLPDGVPAQLRPLAQMAWGDEPLILLFHSHTSESYRTVPPDPRASDTNHIFNSSNTGITRVGEALAEKLQREYNIVTVHSKRIHNWPHHWEAYRNSRETVEELLARYPSIQIVLDLHRQGIRDFTFRTNISGIDAVGVDIVYTTAQTLMYGAHPAWQRNYEFAARLGSAMEELHPGLLRRTIRVDNSRYNQDLHPRMLLLEVGNYLDFEEHAIAAAKLLADPIAKVLADILVTQRSGSATVVSPGASVVAGAAGDRVQGSTRRVTPPPPPRPAPTAARGR